MATVSKPGRVRFGAFEIDLNSRELYKLGIKIKLHDQPFQVLALLLERPGELVPREQLRQRLWPADTFVDFDLGLNSVIKKLRDALGDSAETPRFIETLPRRGYRFIAAVDVPVVESADPIAAGVEQLPLTPDANDVPPAALSSVRFRRAVFAILTTILIITMIVAFNIGGARSRLLGRPGTGRIESIAVLPLVNLSGDPGQEYFAAGVTEALITDLGKISALRVISHTSVMQYRDTKKSLPEIARELNVDVLVEGTVARSDDRVRITANLVQASPEKHLWADSYERKLGDILMLQDDVARAIANGIQIKLTPHEQARLESARTVNPEAYEAYIEGRYFLDLSRWEQGGQEKAAGHFQRATEQDPSWGLPYSGLADSYLFMGINDVIPNEDCPTKAHAAALEALKRDDSSAEAHSSLAAIEFWCNWNWPESERAVMRAIDLNPSLSEARRVHGHWLLAIGRTSEGLSEMKRAVELDPLSLTSRWAFGFSLYLAGEYDQAVAECRKMLELDPNFDLAHVYLGDVYVQKGDLAGAIKELETAVNLTEGGNPRAIAHLGYAYARADRSDDAQKQLDRLTQISNEHTSYVHPSLVAEVYAGLGRKEDAFVWLEKAYKVRSRDLLSLRDEPHFANLRSDPRFAELLRRVDLSH